MHVLSDNVTDGDDVYSELDSDTISSFEAMSLESLMSDLKILDREATVLEMSPFPTEDAVYESLESLTLVVDNLRQMGGISRSEAAVLMKMTSSMEGYQDSFENMPINSFTEVPSMINYAPSMENIVRNTVNVIIEQIRKAIAWIRDHVKKLMDKLRGNRVVEAKLTVVAKKTASEYKPLTKDVVAKAIDEPDTAPPAVTKAIKEDKEAGSDKPLEVSSIMEKVKPIVSDGISDFMYKVSRGASFGRYDILGIVSELESVTNPGADSSSINRMISVIEEVYEAVTGETAPIVERLTIDDMFDIGRTEQVIRECKELMSSVKKVLLDLTKSNNLVKPQELNSNVDAIANWLKGSRSSMVINYSKNMVNRIAAIKREDEATEYLLKRPDQGNPDSVRSLHIHLKYRGFKLKLIDDISWITSIYASESFKMAKVIKSVTPRR